MTHKAIAIALGAILLAPVVALADGEADARMQAMEDRMRSLEDRLEASETTVEAQRELLQFHGAPDVGEGGGLDTFLSGLEWGGWVEASYIYNFDEPDNQRFSQVHFQFNQNHNSFMLDGIKLELGKPADEPGKAGFQIDLLFGENASILKNTDVINGSTDDLVGDVTDSGIFIQEAYVSYNWDGVEFKFGKFETLLGYEVLDAPYNPHITHSQLFYGAIPLFHTGLLASGNIGEDVEWAAGVVNGWNNSIDFNQSKGLLGRLGWSDEKVSVTFNTFIGDEGLRAANSKGVFAQGDLVCATGLPANGSGVAVGDCFGDNNNRTMVFDLVATFEASDELDFYGEVVHGKQDVHMSQVALTFPFGATPVTARSDPEWTAIMVGGVFDINEKTSVALRGEWFNDDGNFRLGHGAWGGEADHYSATATIAHQLTDNLTARLEYRHDRVDGSDGTDDQVFFEGNGSFQRRQNVGLLEVNYRFD